MLTKRHSMPTKKPKPASTPASSSTSDLESFLAALEHPLVKEVHALRAIIAAVDPAIHEDIKWNAPSFHTSEHFATFNLRHKGGVQLVLHLGAKPRADTSLRAKIADPDGLLHWRGTDRATVTFADLAEVRAKEKALRSVLRQWITFV
jgi:hypothetical protein